MAQHRVIFEDVVEADSPEDAAIIVRDMLLGGAPSSIFHVDVNGGVIVVDTEMGNESVVRDDRKRIGPLVLRRDGPTGVLTSPVLAAFYEHDSADSKTDIENVDGNWLRLRGFGPEAFYQWVSPHGVEGEPFAVITVHRLFASQGNHPLAAMALKAYGQTSQH